MWNLKNKTKQKHTIDTENKQVVDRREGSGGVDKIDEGD